MYTNDRKAYRQAFCDAWQKYKNNLALEPVEQEMVAVLIAHPEYHKLLESNTKSDEYELEENPFLHLGLHIAIREQIRMDRPKGIQAIYHRLVQNDQEHRIEHDMMTILAKMMWEAQKTGETPKEEAYLAELKKIK